MEVKISKTNTKLGLIPSVNLPPITTCRANCPCMRECYARKGHFRYRNVKDSMENNLECYKSDPQKYFSDIKTSVNNRMVSYSYFRWHAAGDIVDETYFDGMVRVATELPNTRFLAFTKKFELVNKYINSGRNIPVNLNIVFSAWDKEFSIDNPYEFPVAYVRFKDEARNADIPCNAKECSGDCTTCLKCWEIKRSECVVFDKH